MKRIKTRKLFGKQIKKTHNNNRNKKTRRRLRGGGEKERNEKIIKDEFRNMFINSFKKCKLKNYRFFQRIIIKNILYS